MSSQTIIVDRPWDHSKKQKLNRPCLHQLRQLGGTPN